jgi:hypothetical protein
VKDAPQYEIEYIDNFLKVPEDRLEATERTQSKQRRLKQSRSALAKTGEIFIPNPQDRARRTRKAIK